MHSVCAVHGGFSHHARWLMLLSNEYNSDLLNSKGYIVQNAAFPTSSKDKADFILTHIYNNNRTCFNWLAYEYMQATALCKIIESCHQMASHYKTNYNNIKKTLLLRCDNNFANEKWFKFTPWIIIEMRNKNTLPEDYKTIFKFLDVENGLFVPKRNDHKIFESRSELLYNEVLDVNFYQSMTDFFEISCDYDSAKKIHNAWYNRQLAAKKDFFDWLYNAEYPNFPWYGQWMQTSLKNSKKVITQEEYEFCKNYLKKLYEEQNA